MVTTMSTRTIRRLGGEAELRDEAGVEGEGVVVVVDARLQLLEPLQPMEPKKMIQLPKKALFRLEEGEEEVGVGENEEDLRLTGTKIRTITRRQKRHPHPWTLKSMANNVHT